MKHERNVGGLRKNAEKKKEIAREKTDAAIQQLLKEDRSINFKTVAEVAGVSTAWLYKETDIKERIERLRESGVKKQKLVLPQKATDASKDAKYQALKRRLQEIEAENRGLREHLEAIHGRQRVLADENEIQCREIERLTKSLFEAMSEIERLKQGSVFPQNQSTKKEDSYKGKDEKTKNKVTSLSTRRNSSNRIIPQIESELEALGLKPNSTLSKVISSTEEEAVLSAIESLKEAQGRGEVPNPIGFLVMAIKERWMPNENYKHKAERILFNEWYDIAKKRGLVEGAMGIDGVQYVLTVEGKQIPFSQMLIQYSLDTLKNME